jgi:hypothetical protein
MNTSRDPLLSSARAAWRIKTDPESVRPLARLFWRMTLTTVTVSAVCIFVAAGYFFLATQSAINPVDALPVKRNQRLDRDKLDAVLSGIAAREQAFAERTVPASIPPDPSR